MSKLFLILPALLLSAQAHAATTWGSAYTDMKTDCVVVSQSTDKAEIDFFESECKGFGGYELKEQGGDLRYHPQLSFQALDLNMGTPGAFHDMAGSKVEWIYESSKDATGEGKLEWKGFVYRLSQDDPETGKSLEKLYVVRLQGELSCFLGNPKTNEEARALVKNASAPCVRE